MAFWHLDNDSHVRIKKHNPKDYFSGKEKGSDFNNKYILIAIKYPNEECRKVTVGYFRGEHFYDFLDNTLVYDDGHVPREIPDDFVEWWAEMPHFSLYEGL